ncbi:isochorismatase family protein [Bacillus sp. B15-48]|nr:isochorismatase family protein [Bacillus sp. B15-48]
MINDFQFNHGEILSEKTIKLTKPILSLKQFFYKNGDPIIYINDHYNLWRADLDKIIAYCLNRKSENIIRQMLPHENDYFLIKPKHSAFYGTALNTLLRQLNVDSLVLTGIAGNICVLFTANDAYMREYSLYVPVDCTASNSDEDNQYALTMMEKVLKANIQPSYEFSTK